MTRDDVARWLDRYSEAWRTYDPDAIRSLFSADAKHYYHPWDEPIVGADAIAEDWLADRDEEGTYESRYEPWAVEGSRAVGVGTSTYHLEDGRDRVFHNAFLLEFDDRGACRSFSDIYLEQR
jgi:hypothetical protein